MKLAGMFKPNPKPQHKRKIGLDWGFSTLKIVILEQENNNYILKDVRLIELPSGRLNLSSLIKGIDLSVGVNLSLTGPNVLVRYIPMARLTENEFRKSFKYEAASHLPFPLEELIIDGAILKVLPNDQMLAMFAAAKIDFIKQRLKVLQEAGIKVNILDIDSLALMNAFNYNLATSSKGIDPTLINKEGKSSSDKQEDSVLEPIVLLNIGASVTNINILEDGIPLFSRDINVAGKNFSEAASRDVGILNFVSEIRKSFDYFEAGSAAIIKNIFLSGGGSLVPNFSEDLKSALGLEIKQWNPFSSFEFATGLDQAKILEGSAQFAVAVGLALR